MGRTPQPPEIPRAEWLLIDLYPRATHARIVVFPYIKGKWQTGSRLHTRTTRHMTVKALPCHRDQYVTLLFEILDRDLMIGVFGELDYE